jgi:hypothetical protein
MFWAMTNYHPEVATSIGRILAGYPEIEYSMVECLDAVLDDYSAVFKRLFSIRGETRRVETAEALGRPLYQEINLGREFAMTFGAIRHLLRIRNQYAHAHWLANETGMSMADMEELAQSRLYVGGESKVSLQRVTPEIVQRQEQYGDYVNSLIAWLTDEANIKRGKAKANRFPKPKQVAQPPLHKPCD